MFMLPHWIWVSSTCLFSNTWNSYFSYDFDMRITKAIRHSNLSKSWCWMEQVLSGTTCQPLLWYTCSEVIPSHGLHRVLEVEQKSEILLSFEEISLGEMDGKYCEIGELLQDEKWQKVWKVVKISNVVFFLYSQNGLRLQEFGRVETRNTIKQVKQIGYQQCFSIRVF